MAAGDAELKRHGELKELRRPVEPTWRDLACLFTPDEHEFDGRTQDGGESDFSDIYDSTHLYAAADFAGGIFGQLTNPANRWFELGLDDEDLAEWPPVAENLRARADVVYASLSPAVSLFYSEAPAWFGNVGIFGLGPFWQEERVGEGRFVDRSLPVGQVYIDVDADGEITTIHREFALRGRQVKQQWPAAAEKCEDARRYVIVQCLAENPDYRPGAFGPPGMRWRSVHVSSDLPDFRVERFYHELPIHLPQWNRRAGRTYPIGPGWSARADTSTLQEMERSHLVAAQFAAEPPTMLHNDSVVSAADIVPNAVLHGTITDQGKQLLQTLNRGQNPQLSEIQSQRRREAIRAAFYYGIMQLVNRPQMTATEFLGFQEEHLKLMAPNLVRIQTGGLSPFIARRHNILERAGQMPPPPPELENQRLTIRYVSPLARAMQMADGNAVLRLHEATEQLAVTDPDVRDNFDADAAWRAVHSAFGGDPAVARDPRLVEQRRQIRAQQQQQQAELEQGAQAAEIAATVSHAAQAETLATERRPAA